MVAVFDNQSIVRIHWNLFSGIFQLGLLASFVAGEFGALNKTLIPARVARSVSLTLLDAKDTTAVLQLAKPGM